MKQRVFIVHGWDGYPQEGWFPWLKKELEAKGFEVHVPAMPDHSRPKIEIWVPFLARVVWHPDTQTYFVGHSVGCQTVLRYLATLPPDTKVGGVVLVAPWLTLKPEATEDEGSKAVAKPWLETPVEWKKVRRRTKKFVAIMSDDDPYVWESDGKILEQNIGAEVIVEHQRQHFSGADGVTELPVVRDRILRFSKQ